MLCKTLEYIPLRLRQKGFMYYTENNIKDCILESKSYQSPKSFRCNTFLWSLNFSHKVPVKSYFIVTSEIKTTLQLVPGVVVSSGGADSVCPASHSLSTQAPRTANWSQGHLARTASTSCQRAREGHQMSCMSFSVFNSSQPVTMETVSWGELKTKNAVQIQVAAGVCLSHQRSTALTAEAPVVDVGNTRELWVSLHWIIFLSPVNTWRFVLSVRWVCMRALLRKLLQKSKPKGHAGT